MGSGVTDQGPAESTRRLTAATTRLPHTQSLLKRFPLSNLHAARPEEETNHNNNNSYNKTKQKQESIHVYENSRPAYFVWA